MATPIEPQDETSMKLFMCMLQALELEAEMKSINDELETILAQQTDLENKKRALLLRYLTLKKRYDDHKANSTALGVYE